MQRFSNLQFLLVNPPTSCISKSGIKIKINLNFYFHNFFVVPQKVLWRPLRPLQNLFRHHKGIGKGRVNLLNLIFHKKWWQLETLKKARKKQWFSFKFTIQCEMLTHSKLTSRVSLSIPLCRKPRVIFWHKFVIYQKKLLL